MRTVPARVPRPVQREDFLGGPLGRDCFSREDRSVSTHTVATFTVWLRLALCGMPAVGRAWSVGALVLVFWAPCLAFRGRLVGYLTSWRVFRRG